MNLISLEVSMKNICRIPIILCAFFVAVVRHELGTAQVVNKVVKVVNGRVFSHPDRGHFPDGKDVNGGVAEWFKAVVC